ncbi:la-related protein 7-like [Ostrinia nubilalis]|uniref:la-related protein 7-like n=1 Tax=Ostrinia nubilalis TaxID=29057 RepID=UPI0030822A55
MSESEVTEEVTEAPKHENTPRKRIRHRKKQLYDNILKQMEFYFSDANLMKDRYLSDLVKNDPFVPLETFLKFNKIRSMSTDITDIVKAMKNSTFLEMSEDKQKVKRKTPILPYDADIRTVYVESIPGTASLDWLEKVFSDFGRVAYISLPKFKNTQRIKGYAFIEFDKPEDAQKCINTFTQMGCRLPTCMPPEDLSSIKMFSVESLDAEGSKKEKEESEPPKKRKKKDKKAQKNLELKLSTNESDTEKKVETPSEENKSVVSTPTEEKKETDIESKDEMTSQDESKGDPEARKRKKLRKRSGRERSRNKEFLNKDEAPRGALWGLQVLPKSEWKALRNKYLNLQRKYMKEIKTTLQNKRYPYLSIPPPATATVEGEPAATTTEVETTKTVEPMERTPGVFVKEELPEPCLDVRLTKRTIRSNIHALHVDVKEGQTEVIIRFDTADAATQYCSNSVNRARVLTGADETAQWVRAESSRQVRRARGRTRLLRRHAAAAMAPASPQPTHTHIRFEDE